MKTRGKLVVLGLALAFVMGALLICAKRMSPVHDGTSAEFWFRVCGVDLDPATQWPSGVFSGGFYQPRDNWYVYYRQGFHGQFLFRVKRSVAIADYPRVLEEIEGAAKKELLKSQVPRSYAVLNSNRALVEKSPDDFLSLVHQERLADLKRRDEELYRYALSEDQWFDSRWATVKRFWLNIVFEGAFFAGLCLFALWPWLRSKGKWNWGVHLGLMPLLLFMPYYCGYSSWTFTSAGPSGGALYPWIIIWFGNRFGWTGLDEWILNHVPKILASLSQPLGPMISVTGGRPLGPVAALLVGGVIAGLTVAVFGLLARWRASSRTR